MTVHMYAITSPEQNGNPADAYGDGHITGLVREFIHLVLTLFSPASM